MKRNTLALAVAGFVAAAAMAVFVAAGVAADARSAAGIQNIVLVHGAFVDGSGWRPVYDILVHDGYKVSVVQQPLSGLDEDAAATRRAIDMQGGPVILVGHSYGGAIITEAGDDPNVVGLVYIAAHAPDEGETEAGNGKRFPAAGRSAINKTADGFTYIDPVRYQADFAADLPVDEAAFEAASQGVTAAKVFTTPIINPAWKAKPSWYMVAGADRIINPALERMYAERAKSRKVVEVAGASHSVYRSHPNEVAALIEQAATHAETVE